MIKLFPRRRIMWAGAVIAVAAVSACGASAPGGSSGSSSSGGSSGSSTSSGGALVLNGQTVASASELAQARKEGSLTMYTSIAAASMTATAQKFQQDTGVKVNVVSIPSNELDQRMLTELSGHKLGADVIFTGDGYPAVQSLEKAGIFTPYCFPLLADIPAKYKQSNCAFFAQELEISVISYNTSLVTKSQAPTSWHDVLNSEWKSQISFSDAGESFIYLLPYFWRTQFGLSYWQKLATQNIKFSDAGPATMDAVSRGQLKIAMTPVNLPLMAEQNGAPVQMVIPTDGVPSFAYFTGLASEAKNPAAAKLFLSWSASKAGQMEAATIGNWPAMNGLPGPVFAGKQLPPLNQIKTLFAEVQPAYATNRATWLPQWQKLMKIPS
jgi:iron(III) transport system substrate-binding protein